MIRQILVGLLAALIVGGVAGPIAAQSVQLSPAQQQMLNSLPPAQRQQALAALRQMQSQQAQPESSSLNEPISQPLPAESSSQIDTLLATFEARAQSRSRVVLSLNVREDLTPAQKRELARDVVVSELAGNNLFILDESGVLDLRGIASIPLLGLTESEIESRLSAEPYLGAYDVDARILGQEPIGIEALQPFGYDVFEPSEATLAEPLSGPVPPDYVLGPGDSVRVQLFGNVNGIYEHEVSRDGVLNLPEIGPITVAGIPFSAFRNDLQSRVEKMLIGTQVSVSMGQLRTIRVFVLGDVNRPGSYVVSGLATMSSALYRSGGISEIGTLRRIQLKRNGNVVSNFDAYDLLIRGDTSGDRRLQPGDVIFVPPIGKTVSVSGAVNRPAIYEVKNKTSAKDLVGLAGGLTPEAFAEGARIERISDDSERTVLAVDLTARDANDLIVSRGDTLIVPEVLPEFGNSVELSGHVHRPDSYAWTPGMRLTDLISSTDELKVGVDLDYVLVRREAERGQPLTALSTSLAEALAKPTSEANLKLQARDSVYVFDKSAGRQRVVDPLLEEFRQQATIDRPAMAVEISGTVNAPGEYPLESGMRVSDLVRAGGGLTEAAYGLEAELTRYSISSAGERVTEVVNVNLDAVRRGDVSADIALKEYDYLIIKQQPDWNTIWTVELQGEIRFPGTYRVRKGESLRQVLQRAGGLTDGAFAEGAVFLRETLREQEQEQIETLARRLEADLVSLSLQDASGGDETYSTGQTLLDQLRNTEATGRLVIDLPELIAGRDAAIELRDGDELLIPKRTQVVTVLGETQQNTSHVYSSELSRNDYIDLSGGLTRRADKKRIYVVRANGAVIAGSQSRWFGRGSRVQIRPGDTIVVPLDADKMRPLTFWGSVTQILYQGAIAVAAVRTFDQ
ncbi:MAG: SLBB domain-containing protein [Pseudomonadota bacterium]